DELQNNSTQVFEELFTTYRGVGPTLDLSKPFLLVSQHPVTTEYGQNQSQIEETLIALDSLKMPTIMLWPNADAGSDDISRGIRSFREQFNPDWLHVFKNVPTQTYIHLMKNTACLIGNSSSGIREGNFIGTPVVNIGTRQHNRVKGDNVIDVIYENHFIRKAIEAQLNHGLYPKGTLYGDGHTGKKVADILSSANPSIQKTITY
ncbi:MAG: UDP-N-acetylglucosamine 2-epimerase, partial [Candidatus Margulisbacteria bacterium]|nr:UDP-N-acetylglucosamine 2-epimerase [Candidatus Margulisiibacteriota bacterium]